MSEDESYRTVTTRLRARTPKAIKVDLPPAKQGETWIPRSLIHGADDLALAKSSAWIGTEITFRLMEWKAEELGFA